MFSKNQIAKGHYIFAQASSLAVAVINAPMALTGVANIKHKVPVKLGEMLVAKAEIIRQRSNYRITGRRAFFPHLLLFRYV